jgi:serine/threonine protein phosphatase 1
VNPALSSAPEEKKTAPGAPNGDAARRGRQGRTVVVGDIHGCFAELMDLTERVGLRPADHLVAIGDAIVKGPQPREVVEFLLDRPNTTCLIGNMEWRLLEEATSKKLHRLPSAYIETLEALGTKRWKQCLDRLADWPLSLDLGEAVAVHAGVRPGVPLDEQRPHDLVHIRHVEVSKENGRPAGSRPWWRLYEGPKLVLFGHTVFPEPLVTPFAIGLDTGCVYGGHLSACILPGREIVQVPARTVHWPKASKAFVQKKNPLLSDEADDD